MKHKKFLVLTVFIIIIGLVCSSLLIKHIKQNKLNKKDYVQIVELSDDFKFLAQDYDDACSSEVSAFKYHLNHNYYAYIDLYENNKKIDSIKLFISKEGKLYYRLHLDKEKGVANLFVMNANKNGFKTNIDLPFKRIKDANAIGSFDHANERTFLKNGKKYEIQDLDISIGRKKYNETISTHEYKDIIKIYIKRTKDKN